MQGLADFLLPDILTFDTSSTAGVPNGDCVPSDNTLPGTFPYLGNPNQPGAAGVKGRREPPLRPAANP